MHSVECHVTKNLHDIGSLPESEDLLKIIISWPFDGHYTALSYMRFWSMSWQAPLE